MHANTTNIRNGASLVGLAGIALAVTGAAIDSTAALVTAAVVTAVVAVVKFAIRPVFQPVEQVEVHAVEHRELAHANC